MTHLPDHRSTAGHYLYAALLSDGTVKVGVSWNPRGRRQSLGRKVAPLRIEHMQAALIRRTSGRHVIERELIRRVGAIGIVRCGSREYFRGVKFGEAWNLARQCARMLEPDHAIA